MNEPFYLEKTIQKFINNFESQKENSHKISEEKFKELINQVQKHRIL